MAEAVLPDARRNRARLLDELPIGKGSLTKGSDAVLEIEEWPASDLTGTKEAAVAYARLVERLHPDPVRRNREKIAPLVETNHDQVAGGLDGNVARNHGSITSPGRSTAI